MSRDNYLNLINPHIVRGLEINLAVVDRQGSFQRTIQDHEFFRVIGVDEAAARTTKPGPIQIGGFDFHGHDFPRLFDHEIHFAPALASPEMDG